MLRYDGSRLQWRRSLPWTFRVHAPRLIEFDGHDPVRVSLEAPLKYGPELQIRTRSSNATDLAAGLAPTSGEFVTQIQSGTPRTDALVRILHANQPVRSLWAASLALSIPISGLGGSAGCRSAAPRTARRSSGFPAFAGRACRSKGTGIFSAALLVVGLVPGLAARIGFRVAGSAGARRLDGRRARSWRRARD